ncbi:MAG: DUF4352 domain-containing protein [Polyangiaceae bacterium]|nr:DUF4352 domain-containing protein [Polyangiaceae bacterium]MCW5791679.1 DUF4352 domain-containing protein [Polyangiaceae bacterium]
MTRSDLRQSRLTVAGCAVIAISALLACKKSDDAPAPIATDVPVATAAPTPEPPPPPKDYKVGEEATQLDFKMKVSEVKECKPRYYETAALKKAGHILIATEVSLESITDKQFAAGTYNMKIVDSEGLTYKYSFRGACEPRLNSTTLNKGEKAKGWVTFEVGAKATGLSLVYDHPSFMGPKQTTKFDLGR